MKKRVLLVNEASFLNTGYSTYGKELLKRLSNKYEVAEFALYAHQDDIRFKSLPWKAYPNLPNSAEENNIYNSNILNTFGAWKFEDVILDFKPDAVLSIKDPWMDLYQINSPAKPYINLIWMAPVDARPLQDEWVEAYSKADGLLTYQDWGYSVLKEQGGDNFNWFGSACPAASEAFKPFKQREKIKSILNLPDNTKIIGTVMRNQRRKLFPYLFAAFRKFLDESKRQDVILYCHTSYPDNNGWRIPALLKEFNLSSKVVFTYICEPRFDKNGNSPNKNCNAIFPSTFQDMITTCPQCGIYSAKCTSAGIGVPEQTLANIYNIFDLYVQYSNMEGFGMPICEAAACGTPVCGTDYSAMSDNIRRLDGYPIPTLTLQKEIETGRYSAIPDERAFVDYLHKFFAMSDTDMRLKRIKTRECYDAYYSWDKAADKWSTAIDAMPVINKWNDPPNYHNPAPIDSIKQEYLTNDMYVRWLIVSVLGDASKINSQFELRLIRDLNNGSKHRSIGNFYQSDDTALMSNTNYEPFDRQMAYNEMVHLCNYRNAFEQKRVNR